MTNGNLIKTEMGWRIAASGKGKSQQKKTVSYTKKKGGGFRIAQRKKLTKKEFNKIYQGKKELSEKDLEVIYSDENKTKRSRSAPRQFKRKYSSVTGFESAIRQQNKTPSGINAFLYGGLKERSTPKRKLSKNASLRKFIKRQVSRSNGRRRTTSPRRQSNNSYYRTESYLSVPHYDTSIRW